MSRSGTPVEHDFFRMEKENSSKSKLLQHNRSFKDIQGAISKLNPELLKSVINSGSVDVVVSERKSLENNSYNLKQAETSSVSRSSKELEHPSSVPSTATPNQNLLSPPLLPIYNPIPRCSSETPPPPPQTPTAPLTIFYNGTVSVFDVPCNKAERLMKLAEKVESKALESNDSKPKPDICSSSSCDDGNRLLERLNGDFPIKRRKSLQMFLQKRKARLTFNSPYAHSQPSMVEKSKESVQA